MVAGVPSDATNGFFSGYLGYACSPGFSSSYSENQNCNTVEGGRRGRRSPPWNWWRGVEGGDAVPPGNWSLGRKGSIAISANSKRSFGEILHYARKSRGMTIKQLESRSGVSASFISRIENDNGNPSVEIVGKLAEALGIPVSDFFYDQKGGKILYPLRLAQARLLQDQDVGELMELLVNLSSDQRRAVVQIASGAIQLLKAPGGRAAQPVDPDDPG